MLICPRFALRSTGSRHDRSTDADRLPCPRALAGCTQKPATLNHVTGKVFYTARSSTGVIVFTPDASRGETGKIAFGTIKDDGSYLIATDDTPGAAAGWYRVTVGSLSGKRTPTRPARSR